MPVTDQHRLATEIRPATDLDIPEMARLLAALGYPIAVGELASRFAAYAALGEQALVAGRPGAGAGGPLLGVATLHVTPVLHRAGAVGRVTSLVVDPAARGLGVGRHLVEAAEAWAASRGCVLMEVTSNRRRTDAHAFYERIGYEKTSFRFGKPLDPATHSGTGG